MRDAARLVLALVLLPATSAKTRTPASPNGGLVANDDAYATDEDTPLNVPAPGVLGNDSDSENGILSAVLVTGPAHATSFTLNADGSFAYAPEADFGGSDTFTYHAHAGRKNSNDATVTLTVNPVNDAPLASGDSYSTDEGAPLSVAAPGVLGNDTDTENDLLTAVLVSGPAHAASFGLGGDGSFSYTPAAGFEGTDSFTYKANDGVLDSGEATVTITVNDVPPVTPNIVVITTDDLNLSTLADGIANGWMPNLNAGIIDQGITFANSFVVDSVCSPSRASFLTGQHSHNHGVRNNVYPTGGVTLLDDSSTVATWLHDAGYHTGFMARYINGYGSDVLSSPKDDPTYVPPGWDEWEGIIGGTMFSFQFNENGTLRSETGYQTDFFAAEAAAFIAEAETNDAQPFFLWLTTVAPHEGKGICSTNYGKLGDQTPAPRHAGLAGNLALPMPPSFNEKNVGDKPTWLSGTYGKLTSAHVDCITQEHRGRVETMMAVDDMIGTVIAALDAAGETADTLIAFTSDNGYSMGEHRVTKKQNVFEEAIRVPLYIRVPGSTTPNVATQLVANIDLAPTIVELAQATAGITMDGRSLVPILQDPGFAPWRTGFLVEHKQDQDGVIPDYDAIRTNQFLWVEYVNGERELYDFATDPWQLTSQHNNAAYKATKLALKARLATLKTCTGAGCWQ